MDYIINSQKETEELAKKFAKTLKGGEVIGLIGDLGAGKTVFVKALAKSLGVKKTVISPTFNLLRTYQAHINKKSIELVHIDAYRLKTSEDLYNIGFYDYSERNDALILIEWADKVKDALPKKTIYLKIMIGEGGKRLIKIK